jgi:hypothetical protein
MPVISLIFPPLVWSAFDSVYPSTAVLSAFLRQHGIATTQDDLNGEFASFLIDGPLLSRLGAGKVAHLNPGSVTAAAASPDHSLRLLAAAECSRDRGSSGNFGVRV